MKEHLLNLEQHRERPMKPAYACIMELDPQTRLKVLEWGDERKPIKYGDGATSDKVATAEASKLKFWLIALAIGCLAFSHWVIFRHLWF